MIINAGTRLALGDHEKRSYAHARQLLSHFTKYKTYIPGWRCSSIQHLIEIGCVAPGLASLGNLTVTTAAVRTTIKRNAHLLSVVAAEAGTMRVEAGVVAAKTIIYCCSSDVGAPTRAQPRCSRANKFTVHTQQT